LETWFFTVRWDKCSASAIFRLDPTIINLRIFDSRSRKGFLRIWFGSLRVWIQFTDELNGELRGLKGFGPFQAEVVAGFA
jgi:hypothetical protein